jgi:hypothetical protein
MKPKRGHAIVATPRGYHKQFCKLVRADTPLNVLVEWAEERGLYLRLDLMKPEAEESK